MRLIVCNLLVYISSAIYAAMLIINAANIGC